VKKGFSIFKNSAEPALQNAIQSHTRLTIRLNPYALKGHTVFFLEVKVKSGNPYVYLFEKIFGRLHHYPIYSSMIS
jgi:hypothetical protein